MEENFELELDFEEPNIIAVVKCNRLRWAGHLVKMDPNRAPRKLVENDGRRGVGRPKTSWIDGMQADLRALGKTNWKTLAQDRNAWKNLLKETKSKKWM